MKSTCEICTTFFTLIMFLVSLGLTILSITTDYWVEASISNDRGLENGVSQMHAGLFYGTRTVDWGLGPKSAPFSVFEEIQGHVGFYTRLPWIFIIFFIAVALFWLFVAVLVVFLSAFMRRANPNTIGLSVYLWSGLAMICLIASCIIFYTQFHANMTHNLLLADQLRGGFSTEGRSWIGYSFYLMLGAIVALVFPPLFVFLARTSRAEQNSNKSYSFDPTALLY